ncbi:MAG: peptide chain release factor-like protein [Candidatus Omnitrophota bacterium]|jgi:protein subunit release factor B
MPVFPVSPEKEKALFDKYRLLGVRESDIIEKFIRSGGKGGQNVNKVSTCVYLKHMPSGIEVKCQEERFQALNRYRARVILLNKIDNLIRGRESDEQRRIEKIRRQKRKRSKRAKLKVLEAKKKHSQKKQLRSGVSASEAEY